LVSFALENNGGSAVTGVTSKIYYSTDAFLNSSSFLLDEVTTPSVPAGTQREYFTFRMPATVLDGNYYIIVIVDDGNAVDESNENNNMQAVASFILENTPEPICALDIIF